MAGSFDFGKLRLKFLVVFRKILPVSQINSFYTSWPDIARKTKLCLTFRLNGYGKISNFYLNL